MKQLEEIKARASAATAGPWATGEANHHAEDGAMTVEAPGAMVATFGHCDCCGCGAEGIAGPDAEFIAAARIDVPKLAGALSDVLDRLDEWASYEPWPDAEDTQRWYSAGKRRASEAIRAIITDTLEAA